MEDVIQLLAFILPIFAGLSVLLVIFVNLYLKIRRQFPVRANCWFCNQWTKVHYDQQNCFECPTCLQYNGFNSDGDYNKPIPAQHDELLNQVAVPKNLDKHASSNGLCHLCNNNQQLKIYQLAHFIPLNDANYDVEIEHFQKQLEKAYKLCSPCQSVVKTTIRKQNCLLGLKFSELRRKGLLLLDLNKSHDGFSAKTKRTFLKNLIHFTLIAFATINLISVLLRLDYSDRSLRKLGPRWMTTYVLSAKNVCVTIANNCKEIVGSYIGAIIPDVTKSMSFLTPVILMFNSARENFVKTTEFRYPDLPKLENATILCCVGALMQFISLLWSDRISRTRKTFHLLIWILLSYVNWSYPSKEQYVNAFQVAASTIIISSMLFTKSPKHVKPKKTKHISKRPQSSSQLGELSDCEELEVTPTTLNSTFKSELSPKKNICSTIFNSNTITPVFGQENKFHPNYQTFSTIASTKESLNHSFASDRTSIPDTANLFNASFTSRRSPNNDFDIDISLNKLHLGTPMKKIPVLTTFHVNNDVIRPRPVISPAKLRNVTQNSWVAGGFWRDANGILMPINDLTSLSRSSSQTSGFVSQAGFETNHFNSLSSSVNNSLGSEFECNSVFSEPPYYAMQAKNIGSRLGYDVKSSSGRFYPIVNHEQLVYIAPCGFRNVFANNAIESANNTFSRNLHNNYGRKRVEPNNLLKDWMEKVNL